VPPILASVSIPECKIDLNIGSASEGQRKIKLNYELNGRVVRTGWCNTHNDGRANGTSGRLSFKAPTVNDDCGNKVGYELPGGYTNNTETVKINGKTFIAPGGTILCSNDNLKFGNGDTATITIHVEENVKYNFI
jgi:hypothetical protein